MGFWSMSECEKASVIVLMLFWCWLQRRHMRKSFLAGLTRELSSHNPKGLTPIDAIVYGFGQLAKSNSLISAFELSKKGRTTFHVQIINARQWVMLLITAGELAALKKLTKQPTKKRRVFGNNMETSGISASSGRLGGVDKPGEDKDHKAKIRTLPNFRIAVHFKRLMEEYGVIWNNNVLFREDKHRFFKKTVLCTNHQKPERQLLLKEAINHTIKTGLHGAFLHTNSKITLQLYHLEKHCPHFLKGYAIPKAGANDNKDSVEDKIGTVAATPHHIQPAVRGQLTATYLRSAKLSLKFSDVCHPGFVDLMRPAMTAYGVKASH